jgi:hypothetical protein
MHLLEHETWNDCFDRKPEFNHGNVGIMLCIQHELKQYFVAASLPPKVIDDRSVLGTPLALLVAMSIYKPRRTTKSGDNKDIKK